MTSLAEGDGTPEKLFDDAMRCEGSQRASEEHPDFGSLLGAARERMSIQIHLRIDLVNDAAPRLHCDVYDDIRINACAFQHKERDFIGLSAGVILGLADVFATMLSHRAVLDYIGDNQRESASLTTIREGFPWIQEHAAFQSSLEHRGWPRVTPKDPVRKDCANYLTTLAIDHVFYHELGHVICGHHDYWREVVKSGALYEIGGKRLTVDGRRVRREMEVHADVAGVVLGTPTFANGNEFDHSTSQLESVRLWMFAIGVLFLLFAAGDGYDIGAETSIHPHALARLLLISTGFKSMHEHFPDPVGMQETMDEAWELAVKDIANAWEKLELPGPNLKKVINDPKFESTVSELVDAMVTIHEDLVAYKRIESF